MWMIYINFQKRRQNKKPRSNHFTRIPEVLPDTVMPVLESFILSWKQALTVAEYLPPCPTPPPQKSHFDIWVASGKTEMLLEFNLFTLTDLVKSCHVLMLRPSHFTWLSASVISSSAITRSKIISEFAHLVMQLLPTNDQHSPFMWGASAKTHSMLSINEHFFKSNNTGRFSAMSVGLWSGIMKILQKNALFFTFSHFAALPQKYSSSIWETGKKKEEKRENVRC